MVGTRKSKSGTLASALVSVAGEASDAHAVRLACDLLGPQKGELYIVYVIEVGMGLPVDAEISPAAAKGEQVLKEMEEVARPYKSRTQAELLQSRRTGSAVVREAMDKEVDAIVLGVDYREQYGAFSLGDTVPYVLKHAGCRVVLWRDPMPVAMPSNGGPA